MFIVDSYPLAVLFCFITMMCWGSWGNTQKLAAKSWRYELFYWDGRWKSLGQQVARHDYLEYRHVPKGALLWLRNLDEGVQERIFIYEGGRQIWY